MITIDQPEILQQLQNAVERAVKYQENRFMSHITSIKAPKLLKIFANGAKFGPRHRSFWTDGEGLTLVGIGSAFECVSSGSDRFQNMKERWSKLSRRLDKNLEKRGTGPLMMGGFSFNTSNNDAHEWSHFPESAFVVPRFLFTELDGQIWLTINIEITPQTNHEKVYEELTRELEHLLDVSTSLEIDHLPKIVNFVSEGKSEWLESVETLTQRMNSGEVEKVVLSRVMNLQMEDELRPEMLLEKLLERRTYGFVFAFERDGDCFIGATPERLVKRDGRLVYCDCLAGTEARGKTPQEDRAIGEELLQDEKNLAEHQFVVEMIKTAMGKFAKDVIAPEKPRLVKAESVQHLYTPVSGWLAGDTTLFDAIEALHPTPAMGGTPRTTALTMINELEPHDRGWYAAPIGWIDEEGNGDFAVGIRSCLILGRTVRLFAGCGIVKDSVPEKEYRETNLKFRPILNALEAPPYD
jgi:menaquinone-specific isochorismate synthase